MNWEIIITFLVGGGLGGAVAAYVALRTLKPNIRILTAQEKKVTADAADVAANALVDFVTAFQTERAEFTKRIDAQEKRIEVQEKKIDAQEAEIEAIKEARRLRELETQAERDTLEARNKAELIDTREIRAQNAVSQKRIIKLEDMIIKMSEYIDAMKISMQAADIPVPKNGELLESVRRLKLSREEMQKLQEGKK